MATVTDNLTYLSSYLPYERPPDAVSQYSWVPRGVRRFFLAVATTAKPINDDWIAHITATLPDNFAYIPRSLSVSFAVDTCSDVDDRFILRYLNHISGQPLGASESFQLINDLVAPVGTDPSRLTRAVNQELAMVTSPVWSLHTGSPTVRVTLFNNADAAMAAGFVITHMEFYEYDLTQAQRFPVNAGMPTFSRG